MNLTTSLCILLIPAAVFAAPADTNWVEVATNEIDLRVVGEREQKVLADPQFKWRHAQTPHFVVHFENGIFAAKVGRMAEFFYDYIGKDLQGMEDRVQGRSHIFIFRNEKDWKSFMASHAGGASDWAFSFVSGPSMYLQQADNMGSSASVLSHEMTHLVVNRFLTGPLPLWMNEGIAEWYGEFAYSEFKGTKKSKKAQFKKLHGMLDVPSMLNASSYPADPRAVGLFYQNAKYMVAFLQFEKTPDIFTLLIRDVSGGRSFQDALAERYGITSLEAFAKSFERFAK